MGSHLRRVLSLTCSHLGEERVTVTTSRRHITGATGSHWRLAPHGEQGEEAGCSKTGRDIWHLAAKCHIHPST